MLVITRRIGEALVIGEGADTVTLTILGVKGNQVRVGAAAPKHVTIDREEVAARKKQERRIAQLNT